MFSGGVGSWGAAKLAALEHGTDNLVLLFADVLMEDADTYRFLGEAAGNVGGELVRITNGLNPWQLFRREGMIGSPRADLCSRMLKRDLMDEWLDLNCDRDETVIYLGIDWSEQHRFLGNSKARGAKKRYEALGWRSESPLIQRPGLTKHVLLKWLASEGIKQPSLYDEGFPHANCGGFCIKAGHAHFAHLLKMRPQVYAYHENQEDTFRENTGKDVSILRDRRDGETKPLTLKALRERIEANGQLALFDDEWGGCGCAIDDSPEPQTV